jgi:hypothetical protein
MKIQLTVAMMFAMGANAWGAEMIQVYVNGGNISSAMVAVAEDTASRILATAGVQISWRFGAPHRGENTGAIVVDFPEHTAPNDHPGAMAYSRPYEGVHIVVLYERMQKVSARLRPVLLGHVLVHELTHVLEGVEHHSATGIMRAHWDSNDYNQMLIAPMSFAAEDIEMIRSGIEARARSSSSREVVSTVR